MDLRLHVTAALRAADQAAACGVVVIDPESARPIHEAGYPLNWPGTAKAVAPVALLRGLEVAVDLTPDSLEIQCDSELLVRQITGAAVPEETALIEPIERAAMLLLRLDNWRIGTLSDSDALRPGELAERALREATAVTDLDPQAASYRHGETTTGVPQWTLEMLDEPGASCPAPSPSGQRFPFGPDTPANLCVHAARVAFRDGPLTWPDPTQQRMSTYCPHCAVPLRLSRVR